MSNTNFEKWYQATSLLDWGTQNVLYETLELVKEGKVTLAYGMDYRDGFPCLINANGEMLTSGGGSGVPSAHFSELVSTFDSLCAGFEKADVPEREGFVSTLMADILLHNAYPRKNKPVEIAVDEATAMAAFENNIHREPSDEEVARDWLNSIATDNEPNFEEPSVDLPFKINVYLL